MFNQKQRSRHTRAFYAKKNFGALKSCQRRLSCKQTNSPGFCRMRLSLFLTFAEKAYPRAATSILADLDCQFWQCLNVKGSSKPFWVNNTSGCNRGPVITVSRAARYFTFKTQT